MSPIGSLVDVKKGDFSSTEAGFRIGLPSGTGGFDGRRGIQYSWGLNEGFFYAGVEDRSTKIENSDLFESETDKVVDNLLNDVAGDLFATKFEIVNVEKKIIQFQGHKALQLRARLTPTQCYLSAFFG